MNLKRLSTIPAILIIALVAFSAHAQSGRRQTRPAPTAPVPTPTPESSPSPKQDEKEPKLVFFVATDRHTASGSIPLSFHTAAQRGCADRLRRASADVDDAHKDVSRGEAIEKAKNSSNTYVILLQLRMEPMSPSLRDLALEYLVLTPTTAKVLIAGRAYVNNTRAGPVVVGPTTRLPSGMYSEQWLLDAGEEVADKVLKKLNKASLPK